MPFAHIQYRSLRSSSLDYTQRRNRFLCITLTYTVVFLVIACIFLGLYISANNTLNSYNCSVCDYLGAPYSCGYQLCCGVYSYEYYSYSYCAGSAAGIYFIIMLICFIYGGYELFLIVCIFCRGAALQQGATVVTMQTNNQQYMMGNNQSDPYANYGYPNGNNNMNVGMQQMQPVQQTGNMNVKVQAKATETL